MTRIAATFSGIAARGTPGLVTYVTAGDPDLARSAGILRALDRGGADVIEVGIPFSDPLADGPTIQRAAERALAAGTTLPLVLEMLRDVRADVRAPLVVFSYANPLLRMGAERFADTAAASGVDGVLVLDVPLEEIDELRAVLCERGLDVILLVSPTTSDVRLQRAGRLGSGFLYAISRLGVTGARDSVAGEARALVARVRAATGNALPVAVGFGLSTAAHVREVGAYADAAVVGSALVDLIAQHRALPQRALEERVERYVRELRAPA